MENEGVILENEEASDPPEEGVTVSSTVEVTDFGEEVSEAKVKEDKVVRYCLFGLTFLVFVDFWSIF